MAEYIVEARLSDLFGIKNKGELVRCKDCKHRDPEDKKCDHGDMIHIQHNFPMPDDWFCPLGYAKAGEHE